MTDGNDRTEGAGTSAGGLSWPEEPGAADRPPAGRPRPVFVAIVLMWVGAALASVSAVRNVYFRFFVPESEIRRQILGALEQTNQKADPETVAAMESALTSMLVITVLVVIGWVVLALMTGRGYGWARMVATVLAILNVPWATLMDPILTNLVAVVVGLAAVLCLWLPASRDWFAVRSGKA